MILSNYKTLFLDRDGVINTRLVDDYVKTWKEFEFIEGVLESISIFSKEFDRIFIVTNQQGIGKGIMSEGDLDKIHSRMIEEIEAKGGRIDKIYFCKHLAKENHIDRKPRVGMGLRARKDFREIRFKRSIMVGDSISDMKFGKRLKMKTVYISSDINKTRKNFKLIDHRYNTLYEFAKHLNN